MSILYALALRTYFCVHVFAHHLPRYKTDIADDIVSYHNIA